MIVAMISLVAQPGYAATPDTPGPAVTCQAFAENAIGRMVGIFHDKQKTEEQKKQILSDVFRESVDIDWIGQFVLGRYWKNASPEERAEYLGVFRTYLTSSYVARFHDEDGFGVDAINLSDIKATQTNQYLASALIVLKGEPEVHVSFMLEQFPEKCQVHDIMVEGVSMLATDRSQFSAVASNTGVKGVIDAMKKLIPN